MRLTSLFIVISHIMVHSQSISNKALSEYEDTISQIGFQVMNAKTENERYNASYGMIDELKEVLKYPSSYIYPFEKLETLSILSPDDNSFRLFNWILKKENGEYVYFAIIVKPSESKNQLNTLFILKDSSNNINNPEEMILNQDYWYGALYYEIIPMKKSNNYYTLLGWDGNNNNTTKKIIEVIDIKEDEIKFGKKIFHKDDKHLYRVILEYDNNTSISLKYEKDKKRIIFNHLISINNEKQNINIFNIPDGTYDCYNLKNRTWKFESDIDVRMDKIITKRVKRKNEKGLFNK